MDRARRDAHLSAADSQHLRSELERNVSQRTGGRVRELQVELRRGRVVLRGLSDSYYVKQLAQHGVLELLPDVGLENAIAVERVA